MDSLRPWMLILIFWLAISSTLGFRILADQNPDATPNANNTSVPAATNRSSTGNPSVPANPGANTSVTNSTVHEGSPPKLITNVKNDNNTNSSTSNDAQNRGSLSPPPAVAAKNKTVEASPPPVKKSPPKKVSDSAAGDKKPENDADTEVNHPCHKDHSCEDKKNLESCLLVAGNEMQELSLLIHNKGMDNLNVSIQAPPSFKIDYPNISLGKHEQKMVRVIIVDHNIGTSIQPKIILNAGSGDCVLDVPPQYLHSVEPQSFFDRFSYPTTVTPILGFYVFMFLVLSIGGVWLCCKLRGRKQRDGGVKYQELEMNENDTSLSIGDRPEAESTDGWDEVWDDNWEDAEAGRTSSKTVQSLSSNGLATRRSNKDAWDTWED